MNWRKRGTEKHNGQGGRIHPAAEAQTVGQSHRNFREIQTGTDIFRKADGNALHIHGGESCSRWAASGAISGKARGKMHHLGAGTVKSGGGDSFADGDDVVTINPPFLQRR